MTEKDLEDIICTYPELIEENLVLKGRQVTLYGRRMDMLFEDTFGRKLIIELKVGPIKDDHIGQIMSYEGMLLSGDDPSIRVMLVGNRVPPNIRKSLDHHGIGWKEISLSVIRGFLQHKGDEKFIKLFQDELIQDKIVKTEVKEPEKQGALQSSFKMWSPIAIQPPAGLFWSSAKKLEGRTLYTRAGRPFEVVQFNETSFVIRTQKGKEYPCSRGRIERICNHHWLSGSRVSPEEWNKVGIMKKKNFMYLPIIIEAILAESKKSASLAST